MAATPLKLVIDDGSASMASTKSGAQTWNGARKGEPPTGMGSSPAAYAVDGCSSCGPTTAPTAAAPSPVRMNWRLETGGRSCVCRRARSRCSCFIRPSLEKKGRPCLSEGKVRNPTARRGRGKGLSPVRFPPGVRSRRFQVLQTSRGPSELQQAPEPRFPRDAAQLHGVAKGCARRVHRDGGTLPFSSKSTGPDDAHSPDGGSMQGRQKRFGERARSTYGMGTSAFVTPEADPR